MHFERSTKKENLNVSELEQRIKDLPWEDTDLDKNLKLKALEIAWVIGKKVLERDGKQNLTKEDAKIVYEKIKQWCTNEELKRMGQLCFPGWLSDARLPSYEAIKGGEGVPHMMKW